MRHLFLPALAAVALADPATAQDAPRRDPIRQKFVEEARRLDQALKETEQDEDGVRLPKAVRAALLKPADGDDELTLLQKERYNTTLVVLKLRYLRVLEGRDKLESVFEAARKVLDAELALSDEPAYQAAAREKFVELGRDFEKVFAERYEAGRAGLDELADARGFRLEAEIALLKAKRKSASPK